MHILGVGHYHPKTIIDNAFLESLDIGTTNEWILDRVGIHSRRTVLPLDYIRQTKNKDLKMAKEAALESATDLAEKAVEMALKRAHLNVSDIGLCIASSSLPETHIPAQACLIASRLEIEVPCFDLNSACSSAMAQMHFVKDLKFPKPILLVQSETYTMATDYNDRNTAVLWGDGASAIIVSNAQKGKVRLIESAFDSSPKGYAKVVIPQHGHFAQEGSEVQRFAISKTEKIHNSFKKTKFSPYFIGHQANLRMLESVVKRIQIDEDRHRYNVNMYGNCGGAGAVSVLSQEWDQFHRGDYLSMILVGSGLSWGGAVMEFV